jgi:hypothetical protein
MHTRAVCLIVIVAGAVAAANAQQAEAERDVRTLITSMSDAVARRDRMALERLLSPEFTSIDRQGTTTGSFSAAWCYHPASLELAQRRWRPS